MLKISNIYELYTSKFANRIELIVEVLTTMTGEKYRICDSCLATLQGLNSVDESETVTVFPVCSSDLASWVACSECNTLKSNELSLQLANCPGPGHVFSCLNKLYTVSSRLELFCNLRILPSRYSHCSTCPKLSLK